MKPISRNEILSYFGNNKRYFMERFGVIRLGIFGSFVKGEQNAQSDIDVIIEIEEGKRNIHNFLDFKRFLEKELAIEIDLGLESSIKPLIKEEIRDEIVYV